jgi:starch phosphorylase/maltose phosphorylase
MTTREKLDALSDNMWWSWSPNARTLFEQLNPLIYAQTDNNPKAALAAADEEVLSNADFQSDVDAVYDEFQAYMDQEPHFDDAPRTAYFCMEYGLHESMQLYSGGLGVLAGDHAKAASDLGLPFTAIGMFLREGYFHQSFDADGWQQASYKPLNPDHHPVAPVNDENGDRIIIDVHAGEQPIHVRAWKVNLGRTDLYLLDTDFDANPTELRKLTRRLYQGGNQQRIRQEVVLGIAGLRLLRRLGIESDVYHANEGHCAFLMLELLRERLEQGELRTDAEQWVRDHCVFTTHTPVPAGHDRFSPELFAKEMDTFRKSLDLSVDELMKYGRVHPGDDSEPFTMTVLGLKLARASNGVSKLNGHVARQQWEGMYPHRELDEVPIGSITNGVHLPTWTCQPARDFLAEQFGDDWLRTRHQEEVWQVLADLDDEVLWQYRTMLRTRLHNFINTKVRTQSLPMTPDLDPDALTIGFARRFATYKRAPLIFSDLERARAIFSDADRPVHLIYAGKAHPADDGGKRFIQRIFEISQQEGFEGNVIFLENYDMEIGRMLVSGCDVWLNNPRRPLEASGTSGQKIAAHGGLNLSVLDGWWPEGFDGDTGKGKNGWAIGPQPSGDYGTEDPAVQDREDAASLYEQLENSVIPTFYDRDANGVPTEWVNMMREGMTGLPGPFSAKRMVIDYVKRMYVPEPVEG